MMDELVMFCPRYRWFECHFLLTHSSFPKNGRRFVIVLTSGATEEIGQIEIEKVR